MDRLFCPDGHNEKFEVLSYMTLTSDPPIHVRTIQCLTCGKVFKVEKREENKREIIDYTKS